MPRFRALLLTLAVIGTLLAAYAVAGFFAVPRLLRSAAQDFTSENYARQLQIGTIRFNPFTFALEIRDVTLPGEGAEPLLGFTRLLLNADMSSIWRRGASFSAIELEGPFANVLLRPDGSLNLADLAKPFATAAPAPEPEGPPARVFIDRLRIADGHASFEDRTRPTPFRAQLRPIGFELRDFSTTGKTGNAYSLQGESAAGERFSWNGSFSLFPLASRGNFTVSALHATTLWNYVRDSVAFELTTGQLDLAGDYAFASDAAGFDLQAGIGKLAITDLGVRPQATQDSAGADFVRLDNVQVDDTKLNLRTRQIAIGSIRVAGGQVQTWRDAAGDINLQQLIAPAVNPAPPAGTPAPAAAQAASDTWTFAAPDMGVAALKVAFEDRSMEPAPAVAIELKQLQVAGYSTAPDTQLEVKADVGVNGAGTLELEGRYALDTGALSARTRLAALDLTVLQPYLDASTQMSLLSGKLGGALDVQLDAAGTLAVSGEAQVAQLRTVDKALKQDFIKWGLLRASGIRYTSRPASLHVGTLLAQAPYARVIIAKDQTVNVAQVLGAPGVAAAPAPTPSDAARPPAQSRAVTPVQPAASAADMAMSIGTVRIVDGAANFADFWIQPNYAVSIQSLTGTIAGLTSDPRSRAKLTLAGKIDRYAPVDISGEINLLSAAGYSDVKLSFKGVELTSVTPYSGHFAGYEIEKGKLSADISYHVQERQLKAEHRFVIDQLQLGAPVESPDAIHLPLKLAVALLKDRNGVIDVGLPVSGSLDDPQFRLGPIIWKAVLGLLTKVVTAPFALLGSLFGGGDEMNVIEFAPGDAVTDAAAQERLAGVLKALKERPQLQLDVPMTYAPDLDRPVLAQRKLTARLTALAGQQAAAAKKRGTVAPLEEVLADPARRFDLLAAQYRLDFGKATPLTASALAVESGRKKKEDPLPYEGANAELEAALDGKQPVTDAELEELGKQRSQAVQDALLGSGEVEAARVFVVLGKPQPVAAGADKVRLEMSLK